ncbi:MAG: hypothetical protein ACTTI3_06000, partial [Treponema sp.]
VNFFFASVFSVTITYLLLNVYHAGETVFGVYRAVTASTAVLTPFLAVSVIKKKKNGRNSAGNDKNHRVFAFCYCRLCVAAKFSQCQKSLMGNHCYNRA